MHGKYTSGSTGEPKAVMVPHIGGNNGSLPNSSLHLAQSAPAPPLLLLEFDGTHEFTVMNDPVMGGVSNSTFSPPGSFSGTCAIVPSLDAPGFCKIETKTPVLEPAGYPDASMFIDGALYIEAKSTSPEYEGFKIELFAENVTRPRTGFHHGAPSFKSDFTVPAGANFSTIRVPFSSFSVDWSDYTGECDTKDPTGEQHVCCSAEHPEVCPQAYHLAKLTGFGVWAEGVAGDFDIELKSIAAGL